MTHGHLPMLHICIKCALTWFYFCLTDAESGCLCNIFLTERQKAACKAIKVSLEDLNLQLIVCNTVGWLRRAFPLVCSCPLWVQKLAKTAWSIWLLPPTHLFFSFFFHTWPRNFQNQRTTKMSSGNVRYKEIWQCMEAQESVTTHHSRALALAAKRHNSLAPSVETLRLWSCNPGVEERGVIVRRCRYKCQLR